MYSSKSLKKRIIEGLYSYAKSVKACLPQLEELPFCNGTEIGLDGELSNR